MRIGRLFVYSAALSCATPLLGGLLDSDFHWRAGLGWHGLHCVFGPVHRNLLPIDAALSLVAAAIATALGHVAAWMRRTLERIADITPCISAAAPQPPAPRSTRRARPLIAAGGA